MRAITAGGSRGGITVFEVDDSQKVDPSAQTAIIEAVKVSSELRKENASLFAQIGKKQGDPWAVTNYELAQLEEGGPRLGAELRTEVARDDPLAGPVVDDAAMQITEVVRGEDLLRSTARQLLLYEALGLMPPKFFHCPLVTDNSGVRLAKRHDALSLRALRQAGKSPHDLQQGVIS